jgi:hypothetical protein
MGVAPSPSQGHVGPVHTAHVGPSTQLTGRPPTRGEPKAHVRGDRYQTADAQDYQYMHVPPPFGASARTPAAIDPTRVARYRHWLSDR